MLIVFIGWTCFRVKDMDELDYFVTQLQGNTYGDVTFTWRYFLSVKVICLLLVAIIGIYLFSRKRVINILEKYNTSVVFNCIKYVLILVLFYLSFITIVANGYSPFLYFQF